MAASIELYCTLVDVAFEGFPRCFRLPPKLDAVKVGLEATRLCEELTDRLMLAFAGNKGFVWFLTTSFVFRSTPERRAPIFCGGLSFVRVAFM